MNEIQAGLTVCTVLVVPYIVQAIKTKAMTGNVARCCLLYTSDAADEEDRGDLGDRAVL